MLHKSAVARELLFSAVVEVRQGCLWQPPEFLRRGHEGPVVVSS